ncbi:glutamate--tRNA ligase [Anaplasma platys]|uniref:Glutamate--tRNA ligase n=1 Tax=Anaplasma platys TaxID=949 RepID=A0A858PXA3_9RICK|nr:glutamate--tRNA ligase [Anaplasma platys]QJC27221.1 glutamate--tRNA ligase [Anaplasma platys]
MITRFAPSPTGYIHIGNIRTALVCWLYARKLSGEFILRIDDTDVSRSEEKYVTALKRDLEWLHLHWDSYFEQRARIDRYDEVFNSLLQSGDIYPCYETQEELAVKRSMLLKMGLPPIYDRSALNMTEKEKRNLACRLPYFRLKIDQNREVSWHDEVRGKVIFQGKNISDPIIRRTDGTYTYMFPSVIDDIDHSVTHIVRGEDHVSNTATQICIIDVLKAKVPTFAHLPLVYVGDSKVSKREGGSAIQVRQLRELGIDAMAINSHLARLGTSLPIEPCCDMSVLVESFDIKTFNQAPVKFSVEDLTKFNSKILQGMSFSTIRAALESRGIECSESFWHLVRNNISVVEDVKHWVNVCTGQITSVVAEADREFLKTALGLLPEAELDGHTAQVWLDKVQKVSNRSTKEVLLLLRLAITGLNKGPSLAKLLPFIGRKEVVRRLC